VRDKGIMELVRAFDILQQHDKSYKLLLVGMFEVRDALPLDVQEKIKNDSRIVWTDFQNTDMEYFYAMMNVYVLLSRREGFPTGVLEAQSMSVPVITTHVTGCRDSIIDGKTGLFVNIGVDELVDAIESLKNEHDTSSMSLAARQWVTENFDNIRVWKEIEKLYV
jgi:glycosyltransferase involved in cell wall biosynthesis